MIRKLVDTVIDLPFNFIGRLFDSSRAEFEALDLKNHIDELIEDKKDLEEQLEVRRLDINDLTLEVADLTKENEALHSRATMQAKRINELQDNLLAETALSEELEKTVASLKEQIEKLKTKKKRKPTKS